MPNLIQRFFIGEWRKRTTPAEISRALRTKSPSLRAVENRYRVDLTKMQLRINREVRAAIEPLVKETLRTDAVKDPLEALFDELARGVLSIVNGAFAQQSIQGAALGTEAVSFRKYDTRLYNMIGLNSAPADLQQELIDNWVKVNTELITNTNAKQLQQLQTLFRDTAFTSVRAEALRGGINRIFKGSRNNVALIAVDQVGKLSGQLDQFKQTSAGIEGYYWKTSRDERVRIEHARLEGDFFLWDKPPSIGSPGQPIRCRCTAEPAIDKLLLSGKELREAEAEGRVQRAKDRREAIARSKSGPIKRRKRR